MDKQRKKSDETLTASKSQSRYKAKGTVELSHQGTIYVWSADTGFNTLKHLKPPKRLEPALKKLLTASLYPTQIPPIDIIREARSGLAKTLTTKPRRHRTASSSKGKRPSSGRSEPKGQTKKSKKNVKILESKLSFVDATAAEKLDPPGRKKKKAYVRVIQGGLPGLGRNR